MIKNPSENAGDARDLALIPGSGRSPGGGHGNPFQYSCLENPMDKGAWRARVHRVTKSWTRLKRQHTHTHIHGEAEMRGSLLLTPNGTELPRWLSSKESACQSRRQKRCRFDPWVGKIPWRRSWQPIPVFLPGESHGQRSLLGYKSIGSHRVRHN